MSFGTGQPSDINVAERTSILHLMGVAVDIATSSEAVHWRVQNIHRFPYWRLNFAGSAGDKDLATSAHNELQFMWEQAVKWTTKFVTSAEGQALVAVLQRAAQRKRKVVQSDLPTPIPMVPCA